MIKLAFLIAFIDYSKVFSSKLSSYNNQQKKRSLKLRSANETLGE